MSDRIAVGSRRCWQRMGYYSGRIDGTFGPETRAAIRRYQFEIKADLTGQLNAEQATTTREQRAVNEGGREKPWVSGQNSIW